MKAKPGDTHNSIVHIVTSQSYVLTNYTYKVPMVGAEISGANQRPVHLQPSQLWMISLVAVVEKGSASVASKLPGDQQGNARSNKLVKRDYWTTTRRASPSCSHCCLLIETDQGRRTSLSVTLLTGVVARQLLLSAHNA